MRLNKEVTCVKTIVDILFLSSIYLITYLCIYEILVFYDKSEWFFLIPIFVSILASIINNIFLFIIYGTYDNVWFLKFIWSIGYGNRN